MNKTKNLNFIFLIILFSVLILIGIYNISSVSVLNKNYNANVVDAIVLAQAPNIELITILVEECQDCFNPEDVIETIKNSNINITNEKRIFSNSADAKKLIAQYNISKIPTVVILGEIEKVRTNGLIRVKDSLVFTDLLPVYLDLIENKTIGRIHASLLFDSSCAQCIDLNVFIELIESSGIQIFSEELFDLNSGQGQDLIEQYDIKKLPALLLSPDFGLYDSPLVEAWETVGNISDDNTYILRNLGAPYLDLETNKIKGLISVIYLNDKTCTECYDVEEFHRPVLERIGLSINEEQVIDISSPAGKQLIKTYEITKIPTIIINGEPGEYELLGQIWEEVGSVESDGAYIFREVDKVRANYKDLSKDEMVIENETN